MFIQLYRTSDLETSEPIEFQYKLSDNVDGNRKRPRISQSNCPLDIPGNCPQSDDSVQQLLMDIPNLDEKFENEGNYLFFQLLFTSKTVHSQNKFLLWYHCFD